MQALQTPTRRSTVGLILTLTLGLLVVLRPADAQESRKVYRIGWLSTTLEDDATRPFVEQLRTLGWVEGQHFVLDTQVAPPGERDRLPALAIELVQRHVDIIVTVSTPAALAAKQATATIPIVMAGSGNPVSRGLIASLSHPGGNITGLSHMPTGGLFGKQLELLKEIAPDITRVGMLFNPLGIPSARLPPMIGQWQTAAQGAALTALPMIVTNPDEYAEAFATFRREQADALLVFPTSLNTVHTQQIVDFATTHRVPTIAGWTGFVEAGGLLSYWTDWGDLRRRAAVYVDKILKGVKPADLPVQEPVKFELVLNLKTAKVLGLAVPPTILVLADQVIR